MPDDPEFSEHARAFLDAQKADTKKSISPDDYAFDRSKFPDIPTSAEKKQLEEGRETPSFDHPEPGSWTPPSANTTNAEDASEREARIEFLRDRLTQERDGFERDVSQSFDIDI